MTAVEMLKMTARNTWNKIYALINWRNRPSNATALGATNLNKMDVAINMLDNRVIQLQAEKLGIDVANLMVSSWVMDMKTYKITVTQLNGTVKEYDLNLERIPLNVSLSEDGILTFTYADGTSDSVNVADLIKDTVYDESETITFEKNFRDNVYHVTATIKNNSIEERHLKTEVMQDIRNNANVAQTAANDSLTYSKDSKRWAVGDAEYEGSDTDNSKYYKEQAESAKVAAEKARDEAQAATGAVIMTPDKLGVGKPDNQTIGVEEDGTIKMIAKAASLLITDTQGLAGDKNAETNTQLLINAIADKITTQLVTNESLTQKLASYMTKAMMSNVQVNDQNKVPTSALAYAMQQAITENGNDIAQLNSNFKLMDNASRFVAGSTENSKEYLRTYTTDGRLFQLVLSETGLLFSGYNGDYGPSGKTLWEGVTKSDLSHKNIHTFFNDSGNEQTYALKISTNVLVIARNTLLEKFVIMGFGKSTAQRCIYFESNPGDHLNVVTKLSENYIILPNGTNAKIIDNFF